MNTNNSLLSPKAFENRQLLYLMHFCFAFVSRMWDMGITLLVAELTNNSLLIVALTGLMSALSIFLLMTSIGSWLDKNNRMVAVRVALLVKVVAVSTAYTVCVYLNTVDDPEQVITSPASIMLYRPMVFALPALGAVASISFSAITQSIEKDWIVVLSAKDSVWLSSTNSVMTQIDLMCSSLAPALTGVLFVALSHQQVAIILLLVNAISAGALYMFMQYLYQAWPLLGQKVGVDIPFPSGGDIDLELVNSNGGSNKSYGTILSETSSNNSDSTRSSNNINSRDSLYGKYLSEQFHDFIHCGCAGVMIAYSALYLTVLSFGPLMTVYIRSEGVPDGYIGIFRGLSALSGYTGALLFPSFTHRFGLWYSAEISITYQFSLVFLAASSIVWASPIVSVYVIIYAVLLSRTGLWLFDLCVRQIAQETIAENVRGKVNGQWSSITAFFEMSAYVIAILVPDPSQFWILTTVSACMIGFALVVYTISNPYSGIQKMFFQTTTTTSIDYTTIVSHRSDDDSYSSNNKIKNSNHSGYEKLSIISDSSADQ